MPPVGLQKRPIRNSRGEVIAYYHPRLKRVRDLTGRELPAREYLAARTLCFTYWHFER